jgi:hypothetical protein
VWVNLHKKRIKDKDYYYHTVRDSEGGTKTIYLGSNKKVAVKKAKELGLTHKDSTFSWFKHGPFFLLALSLLMLSLVGFLAVLYTPSEEVLFSQGWRLNYEVVEEGRGYLKVLINSKFGAIVEITVFGGKGVEIFTEKISSGEYLVEVKHGVGKVNEVTVDVVSFVDDSSKKEVGRRVERKSKD